MAVPPHGRLAPGRGIIRRGGRRQQLCLLHGREALQRRGLGGAMDALARRLHDPAPQRAIEGVRRRGIAPGQDVALDVVDTSLLHLPFMLGVRGGCGSIRKP